LADSLLVGVATHFTNFPLIGQLASMINVMFSVSGPGHASYQPQFIFALSDRFGDADRMGEERALTSFF